MLKSMDDILALAKSRGPLGLAVAVADDHEIMQAVKLAVEAGLIKPLLVGRVERMRSIAAEIGLDLSGAELFEETTPATAAARAVALVREGKASLLMKGQIPTADLMRAVLDKENGLRTGRVLSHVAILDVPPHEHLYFMTDGGINIAPDLSRKVEIIQNAIDACRTLGYEQPKVACLAALEQVNPDMPATLDAALLAKMSDRGQIKGGIVDGPFGLDNAVSAESARVKGVKSPVAGCADILMVPAIEAGNILYKTLAFLAPTGFRQAGIVVGARAPIVLLSRADSHDAKLNSIAFAIGVAKA